MSTEYIAPIPVSVITGFLGSGKTTLLRHLLENARFSNTAVIVNEFGEIGIDHHLLEYVDGSAIFLLENGCICCDRSDDLGDTLRGLIAYREGQGVAALERVLIETTGLADPTDVIGALIQQIGAGKNFRFENVITTVDCVNAFEQSRQAFQWASQVAIADVMVLTKTDLAPPSVVNAVRDLVADMNPTSAVEIAHLGEIDADRLFGSEARNVLQRGYPERLFDAFRRTGASGLATEHGTHLASLALTQQHNLEEEEAAGSYGMQPQRLRRHTGINTYSIELPDTLGWETFSDWLGGLAFFYGKQILRIKGILHFSDEPLPFAVHGVNHLIHPPIRLEKPATGDRISRIVFITRGLSLEEIWAKFPDLGVSPHGDES